MLRRSCAIRQCRGVHSCGRLEKHRGCEQALAAGMRGRELLPGRELLALDGRLECVVVAIGAMPFLERASTTAPRRRAPRRRRRATTRTRAPRRACARAIGSSTRGSARRCVRRDRPCRRLRRSRSRPRVVRAAAPTIVSAASVDERGRSRSRPSPPAATRPAPYASSSASRSTPSHSAVARRRSRRAPARRAAGPCGGAPHRAARSDRPGRPAWPALRARRATDRSRPLARPATPAR